jgi:geranylgeranyl diphosphate synthase type II
MGTGMARDGKGRLDDSARSEMLDYLDRCKTMVQGEFRRLFKGARWRNPVVSSLYDAALDYPLRGGKALRPALCLLSCGAAGGAERDALNSAVAIELFHNGFLIKDDLMDHSEYRRGLPTLHRKYWPEFALDVGDALNVLSMRPLFQNLETIGAYRSLLVFTEIQRMAQQSVEGQAMELTWIRANTWDLEFRDYYEMARRKTCWYTCAAPIRIGTIVGLKRLRSDYLDAATRFAMNLGIGFQIEDDLLNLVGSRKKYGKEILGDIWEGKRTIMLIHLLQNARSSDRRRILQILQKPRSQKRASEILYILDRMNRYGSLQVGRAVKRRFARKALSILESECGWMPDARMKGLLVSLARYATDREL